MKLYQFRTPDAFNDYSHGQLPYKAVWVGFKDFTTAHGIPHVNSSRGPIKVLFWSVITLGCLGTLGYNAWTLFNFFFDYPVNVLVDIKSERQLDFPAITICNTNPVRSDLMNSVDALSALLNDTSSDARRRKRRQVDPGAPPINDPPPLNPQETTSESTTEQASTPDPTAPNQQPQNPTQQDPNQQPETTTQEQREEATMQQQDPNQQQQDPNQQQQDPNQQQQDPNQQPETTTQEQREEAPTQQQDSNQQQQINQQRQQQQQQPNQQQEATTQQLLQQQQQDANQQQQDANQQQQDVDQQRQDANQQQQDPNQQQQDVDQQQQDVNQQQQDTNQQQQQDQNQQQQDQNQQPISNQQQPPQNDDFLLRQQILTTLSNLGPAERQQIGHQLEDLIIGCEYAGYDCNITGGDFDATFRSTYGNCFTYNWGLDGTAYRSVQPGPMYGLKLLINIDQSLYVGDLANSAGVRVVVHNQKVMPFPEDEGVSASPGQETFIGIQKLYISRMGDKYGDCMDVSNAPITDNVFAEEFGCVYSNKACEHTCYQRHVIEECGCADPLYPRYGAAFDYQVVSSCDSANDTQDTCKTLIGRQYANDNLECNCLMSCIDQTFSTTVSTAMWPSDRYKGTLRDVVRDAADVSDRAAFLFESFDEIYAQNLIKLNIYFEEFNYESITETPAYLPSNFVGDLGGILGLYIGFSIMTILEFVELFWDFLALTLFKCCSCGNRKKTKPEI